MPIATRGLIIGGPSAVLVAPSERDSEVSVKNDLRFLPCGDGEAAPGKQRAAAMTVEEVMTRPVVVVRPEAPFWAMAQLLRRHRISGLPVVDDDQRLLGLVSEIDLLRRLVRAERQRVFRDPVPAPTSEWQSRATADTARGLMSQPAISTAPAASVDGALELMRRRAVRRLPVIDERGRVVGIVTRTDLVQPHARTDEELRVQLCEESLPRQGVDPAEIRFDVQDGNVLMSGTLAGVELVRQVERAVRDTPGVVSVESRLRGRAR